jgi:hypothetical protein
MKKIIPIIALLLFGLNSVHASQTFSKMLSKRGPLTKAQQETVAKNVGIPNETLKS